MNLLLAPHMDDETLFAAFICLREKPLVVFCFDGAPRHGTYETRWSEACAALRILGCETMTLREEYDTLADRLSVFTPERVWAPLPEEGGNLDHNFVGELAEELWPDLVTFYTTYTWVGRSTTLIPVEIEPGWANLKREALNCYRSQRENPHTAPHFGRGLEEYEVQSCRV